MKNATSISIEATIIAILTVIVLIVIISFIFGGFPKLVKGLIGEQQQGCEENKGNCYTENQEGKNCIKTGCQREGWCCYGN